MNKTTCSNRIGKLGIYATTGALIALPLLAATTQTASAAPGDRYEQNRNDRNDRNDRHDRNGRGERNGRGNYNHDNNNNNNGATRGTILATVTGNPNGNRFTVRADDNRTFTVQGDTNT